MSSGNVFEALFRAWASVSKMLVDDVRNPTDVLRYVHRIVKFDDFAAVLDAPPKDARFMKDTCSGLWVDDWERFYREVYSLKVNLAPVFAAPTAALDHVWPVFSVPEARTNRVWAECRNLFPSHSYYGDDLEQAVPKNDRRCEAEPYMVRFRARVEADQEFKNLSANALAKQGVKGITLHERLLLEQFVWWASVGFHLDLVNWTLCAGSRSRGGVVPTVDWRGRRLRVDDCCGPGSSSGGIRARSAV